MTGRVIVITSGKGGVGKTTTSANIGTALAKNGASVVLIDTDIGLRNLDLLLGLENRIVYTLVDVVEERCKLKQALVKDKKNPNLCLLAAAQTRDKSAVTAEQLKAICEELQEEYDFILVDCPAGIEQGFQTAVAGASEAIVVTTPEMSAVRDADRIIGLLEAREEIKSYKLLLNRVRPNLIKSNDMMSVEDVVDILSCDLIGIIPEDTGIITSTNKGEPIVNDEKSLAGKAYLNVAKRINGEDVPFLDIDEPKGFAAFVAKVKKIFGVKAQKGAGTMRDIFTGLYNKVLGFFQADRAENSKETATNRLKLVLLHDRTNLDTITMQKLREQLVAVISKYIEIDNEALDLNLEGEGDSIALMLNIPVIKARTKEEIEELEKAEQEAKAAEIRAAIEAEMAKSPDSEEDGAQEEETADSVPETADEEAEPAESDEPVNEETEKEAETPPESENSDEDSQPEDTPKKKKNKK